MKFSKEARIGLLVASSILILFAGFYFLKGANIFSGENNYYVYYDNVQGLQPSSDVQVKGMSIGRVSDIALDETNGKVKVTLAINKKTDVTKGTVAKLTSTDLLGTKAISLDLGKSKELVEEETQLPSVVEGGIIDAISAEVTPLLLDVRHVVGTLDTVLLGVNSILDPASRANLQHSIANLDVAMANFSQLSNRLNGESQQLAGIIRNTNTITANLADNNQRIDRIIKNADYTINELTKTPISQTMAELKGAANQLQGIVTKINSNEGSLGLLVNDKALYNNLNASLQTLDLLMADVEAHPARYINVTVFGRRKQP